MTAFLCPPWLQMLGVTDRGKEDRSLSLITEWCAGGDLSSVIQGAFGGDEDIQLQYRAVLRYARNIAAGVDHLHRHKVLHLDLKPANVLVRAAFSASETSFSRGDLFSFLYQNFPSFTQGWSCK